MNLRHRATVHANLGVPEFLFEATIGAPFTLTVKFPPGETLGAVVLVVEGISYPLTPVDAQTASLAYAPHAPAGLRDAELRIDGALVAVGHIRHMRTGRGNNPPQTVGVLPIVHNELVVDMELIATGDTTAANQAAAAAQQAAANAEAAAQNAALAALPAGGTTGQIVTKLSNDDFDAGWTSAGSGDMSSLTYDPTGIGASAFDLGNFHGALDGGVFN